MEQLSIYDELGFENDPVYLLLSDLQNDASISIGIYTVEKTIFGMYEIKTPGIHECSKSLDNCYKQLNKYLSPTDSRLSF